jgi:hypothetical protein
MANFYPYMVPGAYYGQYMQPAVPGMPTMAGMGMHSGMPIVGADPQQGGFGMMAAMAVPMAVPGIPGAMPMAADPNQQFSANADPMALAQPLAQGAPAQSEPEERDPNVIEM